MRPPSLVDARCAFAVAGIPTGQGRTQERTHAVRPYRFGPQCWKHAVRPYRVFWPTKRTIRASNTKANKKESQEGNPMAVGMTPTSKATVPTVRA